MRAEVMGGFPGIRIVVAVRGRCRRATVSVLAFGEPVLATVDADYYRGRMLHRRRARRGVARGASSRAHGDACLAQLAWWTGDISAARAREQARAASTNKLTRARECRDLQIAVAGGLAAAEPGRARIARRHRREGCADVLRTIGRRSNCSQIAPSMRLSGRAARGGSPWSEDVAPRKRHKLHHTGRKILRHAAVCARRGDLAQARDLVARVEAPFAADPRKDALRWSRLDDEFIEAWLALGESARVEVLVDQLDGGPNLSAYARRFYVPALVRQVTRSRVVYLGPRSQIATRVELIDVIPAVLRCLRSLQAHSGCMPRGPSLRGHAGPWCNPAATVGSGNSDLTDSGNSGHSGSSSDDRGPSIAPTSSRGEARNDRHGQKTRSPGPAARRAQPGRDGQAGRRLAKKRASPRR
jgi:hypothetical protein